MQNRRPPHIGESVRCAAQLAPRFAASLRAGVFLGVMLSSLLFAVNAQAEIALDPRDANSPIRIAANLGESWTEGAYRIYTLRDGCEITQGQSRVIGREAVLWIEAPAEHNKFAPWRVIAYVDGQTTIFSGGQVVPANTARPADRGSLLPGDSKAGGWIGRLQSTTEPQLSIAKPVAADPANSPRSTPLYARAWERFAPPKQIIPAGFQGPAQGGVVTADGEWSDLPAVPDRGKIPANPIKRTQYSEFGNPGAQFPLTATNPTPGQRRIQFFPRSAVALQWNAFPSPGGQETVVVINSGVQVRVDGLPTMGAGGPLTAGSGTIDVSADRVIVWYAGNAGDLQSGGTQGNDTPLEIYLEGDVIFREGDRVIYAQAMYYNVPLRNGTILNAEFLTPVQTFQGLVRLRANVIRQLDEANFVAEGASVTTSNLAVPTYELRSGDLTINDTQIPLREPLTMLPVVDPLTGEPVYEHRQEISSTNNVVFLGGLPVFYWPWLRTDMDKPTFYVNDFAYGNDTVFGQRLGIGFDAYQVLGFRNPPRGTSWDFDFGDMSKRGFYGATKFTYNNGEFLGTAQPTAGIFDGFYIHDTGLDRLGRGRIDIVPEATERYRILGQHRQQLSNGWRLTAELGPISDRNFLEQYFESEWEQHKDLDTGIELKRTFDNQSLALSLDYDPNEFFIRTQQLPRADYYNLGTSLFDDFATTYGHIEGSYSKQRGSSTPLSPQDAAQTQPLPYQGDFSGEKLAWRQSIELPLEVADEVKLVPFALGEAAHWGEVLDGSPDDRLYGQLGVRTSLPFVGLYPEVESDLFNVHGIAHKTSFDAEYSYTDSNRNVDDLAIYDEIDDNNVQHFRQRLIGQDFPGLTQVPAQFDERFYGVRRGLMNNVTGPTEIADDLQVFRLDWRNRVQTKRGPAGNRRIIDWISFDVGFEIFPDKDQNFGENAGLLDYDLRWHVGDRLTLLSSGAADFFGDGQRYFTAGAILGRPTRTNLYLAYTKLGGPIERDVLSGSFSYRMSPKWIGSVGAVWDMSDNGYFNKLFTITRVGESFLVSVSFNGDETRDSVGASLFIEPRFLPMGKNGGRAPLNIPVAGQFGLE